MKGTCRKCKGVDISDSCPRRRQEDKETNSWQVPACSVRRVRSRSAAESVCGLDVNKPVSADQIHPTHGTQSPQAHETASSIECGS